MLRNPYAEHTDFSDLYGIIESNPKVLPSNLDMIYERNGHFLVGEWKNPDESFGGGQDIMLKAMAKNPKFTVIKVCGYSANAKLTVYDIHYLNENGTWLMAGQGLERLKQFIRNWYAKVDNVS